MNIFYDAFGWIMQKIYEFCSFGNYGLAIIIFTLLTKLILLPLTIKQQKSMKKTQAMQKELEEIQRLFKGDQNRIAEETQKLYTQYGVSPMSGCLPMLIQLPLIMVLYQVVREPITYILGKSASVINGAAAALGIATENNFYLQLDIMNKLSDNPALVEGLEGFASSDIINFNFLGINLGMIPTIDFGKIGENPGAYLPLLLIPILAAATTFLQSMIMNKLNGTNSGSNAQAAAMTKSMSFMMPVMILVMAFSVPASLGLYWIIGNIFQIGQQYLLHFMLNKKDANNPDKIIETKGRRV